MSHPTAIATVQPAQAMVTASASVQALRVRTEAQIEALASLANRYPRDVGAAVRKIESMALMNMHTAAACIYSKPQAGGTVTGPSIRMAELFLSQWRNLTSTIVREAEEDDHVEVEVMVMDLEHLTSHTEKATRRIIKKDGTRYADHMIEQMFSVARSIALRNAVFRIVPRMYINELYRKCRAIVEKDGSEKPFEERVAALVKAFGDMKVSEQRLLASLGKSERREIDSEDLIDLRAIFQQIRDKERTVEEVFPQANAGVDRLQERVAKKYAKEETKAEEPKKKEEPKPVQIEGKAEEEEPKPAPKEEPKPAEAKKPATPVEAEVVDEPEEKKPEPAKSEIALLCDRYEELGGNVGEWLDDVGYDSLSALEDAGERTKKNKIVHLQKRITELEKKSPGSLPGMGGNAEPSDADRIK